MDRNGDRIDLKIFLGEYLSDVREGLQAINTALLALEKDHSLIAPLDEIFREFHTIKSSSAMLEFSEIAEMAHFTENLIDRLRKRELAVTKEGIDILFEIVDTFEKMINDRVEKKNIEEISRVSAVRMETLKHKIGSFASQEVLVSQGVIALNEHRIIESFNPAAERIFGYTADEVTGQNINTLMPEPYKSNHDQYVMHYLKTGVTKVIGIGREFAGRRKDGTTFPMELAVSELRLADRRLFIGIVRDITARKTKTFTAAALEKIKTVRVSTDLLDSMFNYVGELIITKNRIDNLIIDIEKKELKAALAAMDRTINALQDNVSAARMVPVDEIFQKFPRMVRDLAKNAGKEIEFKIEGSEVELDKAMLDSISEPVIHLLRNAIDHGIEREEERLKKNKQRKGSIRLAAKRAENHILIEVEDDGSGINIEHMKEVAVKMGFGTPEDIKLIHEKDMLNLLFKPGFSSAEEVTNVSGRGIGLDVVKTAAEKMGGSVTVETHKDSGSKFIMQLPLTSAIMQTLLVGVGDHIFAIPSDIIIETIDVKADEIKEIHDRKILILRKEVLPFVELGKALNVPGQNMEENHIAVIISRGDRFMALGVDTLIDQMETIIKPFDPVAQRFKGFSGGTILGDGSVALLLDIPALFEFKTV